MVLVVDDDAVVRDELAQLLAEQGYVVETAANGREALDRLERGPAPDVVLLDLMMPVVDGWTVLARAKDASGVSRAPVLVMTAAGPDVMEPMRKLAKGYIKKPFDLPALLRAVDRCCGAA